MSQRNTAHVPANLIKQELSCDSPNIARVSEIIYARTFESRLHLAVVMDLCTRRIVGLSMQPTMHRDLVIYVLIAARWRYRSDHPETIDSG
jgi:putative transposase